MNTCDWSGVRRTLVRLAAAAVLALPPVAGAFTGFTYTVPLQPEQASGYTAKPGWATERFAVAAANPLATDAGFQVLAAGGSALDAAIAVQMVLTLVEPQSSGIGGGAFLLHHDGRELVAYDGRETAPQAVGEDLFVDADGQPLAFMDAVASGRSVGVPGVLRMLEMAHVRHGRLPWAALFVPAITLAEQGFPVSARLHTMLETDEALRRNAKAAAFFYDDAGKALPVGHMLRNPALAAVLRQLAAHGSDAFYFGPIARDLVAEVRAHPERPGALAEGDLTAYTAMVRDAICTDWKRFRVCGFPPPSSGHLTIMQMLGILEHLPPVEAPLVDGLPAPDWLHQFTEAARLAFADRGLYIADPDFVEAPGGDWTTLLAPAYLRARAALIGDESMVHGVPGSPAPSKVSLAPQPEQLEFGTSHLSIVDAYGNALAMTTTIESAFGARILVDGGTNLAGGFLLNNELTDFSFAPRDEAGRPIANRVEPGKRPRSSMSPTLVFERDSGALVASLGSPGGAAIIHYTAKALIAMLDWGLDAQRALDLPHAVTLGGPTFLEEGRFPEATIEALRVRGHEVVERELTSGLQAIRRTESGFFGGADPRREGIVMGE
ncbi:MAG TPA: gamma-glutamyltransferase family protein [Rhodocyclaceae bacterium]|nr:gamma-glutamyltransferase family protein [Rhodocyclaceae bacterium]